MKKLAKNLAGGLALITGASVLAPTACLADIDRTTLPIPDVAPERSRVLDVRDVPKQTVAELEAPEGAPNVVVILLDDFGFGQADLFGGPINMPTAKMLAENGLQYNQFHTAAISAATRTALMTGRNHHINNMSSITETATGIPGNTSKRPNYVTNVAKTLSYNGYSTGMFGKNHEVALWQTTDSGPLYQYPIPSGFDKFYGFIGAETNQFYPILMDGVTQIPTPTGEDYMLTGDLVDKSISWISSLDSANDEKPFFLYMATGATHAPHQVTDEWIDKYKGRFDKGWSALREETYNRQLKMGIIPEGTELAPWPDNLWNDWDSLSAEEQKAMARQMEVFAGFAEYTDHEIGRLVQRLKDLGEFDNTLIYYIMGDNGASTEGQEYGFPNEILNFNGIRSNMDDVVTNIGEWGTAESYSLYAAPWAIAGNSPFSYAKQVASDYGGTRNGLVVSWPDGINKTENGSIRSQWHHVIDVVPTILEASKLPEPKAVDGVWQYPIQGTSMLYSFNDASAPDRHKTQYFEVYGNRAVYDDGWYAGVIHKAGWEAKPRAEFENDKWELYNTKTDFSLSNDLADEYPEKLTQMRELFDKEAYANYVYPLDDRGIEPDRLVPSRAGRPQTIADPYHQTLYDGMINQKSDNVVSTSNKSFTITANIEVGKTAANGSIYSNGSGSGGYGIYVIENKPYFIYNYLDRTSYKIQSSDSLTAGKHTIKVTFTYDGGGSGKGGTAEMYLDSRKVGEVRIEKTVPVAFGADSIDVGMDNGAPLTGDYIVPNKFNGKINFIQIDIDEPSE